MLKQRIDGDIKAAMLGGDKQLADILRNLKSAILYAEVAENARAQGLSDEAIQAVLSKEAKKRQESADLYRQAGAEDRAAKELFEKEVIERYLPPQLSDEEIAELADTEIAGLAEPSPKNMGQVIAAVKAAAGSSAEGGRIARIVKDRLNKKER